MWYVELKENGSVWYCGAQQSTQWCVNPISGVTESVEGFSSYKHFCSVENVGKIFSTRLTPKGELSTYVFTEDPLDPLLKKLLVIALAKSLETEAFKAAQLCSDLQKRMFSVLKNEEYNSVGLHAPVTLDKSNFSKSVWIARNWI
ncbi:hypothetical protein Kuja_0660 [Vibrio phage vB_VchM_Kuja]|uniref:Uncharacterized protein n=1 Tax=Vibrio phage vB_VchM_Kuja TaxID=2686437 RepID=A0A6B9JHR5_9CAUD|nr:hypothetical protein HWC83_gp170 [Vibrio phage vB_VchM_Kuja]QGZ16057.1 hypothetical protein Kuja_0660 [Vibrio phage vB_VchM_Kuja]